jgi:hypothetical protein
VAAGLLGATGGWPVHLLLHGDARGADQSIDRAARRLSWLVQAVWLNGSAMAAPPSRSVIASCSGVPCLLAAQSLSSPGYPASVLVVVFPGRRGTASLLQLARKLQRSQEQAAQLERAPALAVVEISAADASFSPARQR